MAKLQLTPLSILAALILFASPAVAQEAAHVSFGADVATHVIVDPTTYVPALIGYDAMSRDWTSSQPLFAHGFVEHNPEFTVGGLANGQPVSYGAGRQQILGDLWLNLEISAAHNVAARAIERVLLDRHPQHAKLIRRLGWAERTFAAGWLTYHWSANRYRQWQANEQVARQLGYGR
jgi:hypothetical protein